MKTNTLFLAIKVLSTLGILLAAYLLWQQFFHPLFQPCYVNSFINCTAIISGPVSKTFGISTPFYGLIGYIAIFIGAFLKKKKTMLAVATFGLIFCLSIAYKELFQLKVICPICLICQCIMISIFAISTNINVKNKV